MKSYVIGKTRPRWAIALVVVITLAGIAMTACGASKTIVDTMGVLTSEAAWLRRALGMILWLLLGTFVLQAMVVSEKYWELTDARIRYRSSAVKVSFLRYAWDVLRGRDPEVDVELVTDDVVRIRISWRVQHVTLVSTRGLPVAVFPVTVAFGMRDGTSVEFERLSEDAKTLGEALCYLTCRPSVMLDDPDDLLGHMTASERSKSLYEYLEGLYRARTAESNVADDSADGGIASGSSGESDDCGER